MLMRESGYSHVENWRINDSGFCEFVVRSNNSNGEVNADLTKEVSSFQKQLSRGKSQRAGEDIVSISDNKLNLIAAAFGFGGDTTFFRSCSKEAFQEFTQKLRFDPDAYKFMQSKVDLQKVTRLTTLSAGSTNQTRGASVFVESLGQGHEYSASLTIDARARYYDDWVYGYEKLSVEFHFEEGKPVYLEVKPELQRDLWVALNETQFFMKIAGTPQEVSLSFKSESSDCIVVGTVLRDFDIGEFKNISIGDTISIRISADKYDAVIGHKLSSEINGQIIGPTPSELTKAKVLEAMLLWEDEKKSNYASNDAFKRIITLAEIKVVVQEFEVDETNWK